MNYEFLSPAIFVLIVLFGLAVGSFLNAWVYRTRNKLGFVFARSECVHCHCQLSWFENIPVLSFVCLRGRCKSCKEGISFQYPVVEIIMALLFAFSFWYHSFNFTVELVRDWYILIILVFIFLYDLKYKLILDRITLPAIGILFVLALIFGWQSWQSMLIGAGVGGGFFFLQYFVSRGRWVGGGDIRLGLLMGIILGWPVVLFALFLSYIIGAVVSVVLLAMKKVTMKTMVPFGVYLTVGTLIAMFYGEKIVNWYVGLIF